MKKNPQPEEPASNKITAFLAELVGIIPGTSERPEEKPEIRTRRITKKAAMRAGALSSMLAIPPGPLGFATVIPDLMGIWRLQRQMVADVAGVFGTSAELKTETMVYCLFKHGGAALTRDLVVRAGERILIRDASIRSIRIILSRVGLTISERVITKSLCRFIPLLGAVGLGAYAYYDTTQVAATAIALFSGSRKLVPPRLSRN
ncbi:MAG: hypothetical protein ABI273_05750 [Lacunisphaera sp.]